MMSQLCEVSAASRGAEEVTRPGAAAARSRHTCSTQAPEPSEPRKTWRSGRVTSGFYPVALAPDPS